MRCASTSPPTGCITRGLMVKSLFTKILGSRFKRELKRLRPVVDGILRHEERLKALSDAELQAQTPKLRAAIAERTSALVIAARSFGDRKSTRLNSSHANISYAVFCL